MRGVIADSFNGGKNFVSKEFRRSVKRNTREVRELARSVGELVDVEEFLKTIHRRTHPDEHGDSEIILHQAADWTSSNQSKQFDEEEEDKEKINPDTLMKKFEKCDLSDKQTPRKSKFVRHGSFSVESTFSRKTEHTRSETEKYVKTGISRHHSLPSSSRPRAYSIRSMK